MPRHAAAEAPVSAKLHVIVLGHPLRPGAIADVRQRIADVGGNIESVTQLSTYPVSSLDLIVADADEALLRGALVRAAGDTGLDIAVERAGLSRRAKRLVVLDVDSTLVQGEGIDELAELAGVGDRSRRITAAAMAGRAGLRRVAARPGSRCSPGYRWRRWNEVRDELRADPRRPDAGPHAQAAGLHGRRGVRRLHRAHRSVRRRARPGLRRGQRARGRRRAGSPAGWSGEVVDRAGKAAALRRFADQFDVPLAQTVAIGDGANDIDMLRTAGLGIAFNAKAALRETAEVAVNHPFLDAVLYVLGISRSEIEAADTADTAEQLDSGRRLNP